MLSFPVPVIGFAAYSGTGKTTLLEKLIPILVANDLRVGVVKASHHSVDPDTPGKDSHRLRTSGSTQLVLSMPERSVCYTEHAVIHDPLLEDQLALLDPTRLDLVLVEGFRDAAIPKIELHRKAVNRPFLHPHDSHIIALAWDEGQDSAVVPIPQLNINQPGEMADFILNRLQEHSS